MRSGSASRKTSPSPDRRRAASRAPPAAARRASRQSVPLPTQAPTSSRAEGRFDAISGGTPEQHAEPLVADGDAALGVEHAQPVRHIVERGIEPAGQQAHVAVGHHGIEQDPTQAVRDEFQRDEERHQHEGENPVVRPADRDVTGARATAAISGRMGLPVTTAPEGRARQDRGAAPSPTAMRLARPGRASDSCTTAGMRRSRAAASAGSDA